MDAARLSARRPTIRDVARIAGVSTVTVSRVANTPELVQPATRERVQRAMQTLGYVPNLAARTMRTNHTRSVGFVVPDLVNFSNAAVAQSAERYLAEAGYCMLVSSSDWRVEQEVRAIEALGTRQVDGLILYVSDEDAPGPGEAVQRYRTPCVVLDRTLAIAADLVLSDHGPAIRETVRYLVGLGHRRLALFAPDLRVRPIREREAAFMAAIAETGLATDDQLLLRARPEDHLRFQAAQALFERDEPPTAVIAEGSRLVRSVIVTARARGLAVPEDLSLVGLDAADIAAATTPELTSVQRDYAEIGRTAVELLLERLACPEAAPRRVLLESQVLLKGSCAPPRS